ncbi:MAG: RNA polymerase sigma factor [Bacteroidales bacterium]|nr:RNA polymerase sigma factor [Bacteroidales bacterium]
MTIAEYNLCVEQFADGIYRFILKNLRDSEQSRDVVQETYTRLWTRYTDVNFDKAKSYLFTTAYHTMIDMIRREKTVTVLDEIAPYAGTATGQYSDLKEVLDEAVSRLPEIQRSVLLLRDYEGYNYKEIEEITGLNESQVKVYIYRARQFLMQYIGTIEAVI